MSTSSPPPPPDGDASFDETKPGSAPVHRWRLRFGDQIFGPYTLDELRNLVTEGRLDRSSLLSAEGGDTWQPAAEIPELAGLFSSAALPMKAKPPQVQPDGGPDPLMLHLVYGLYAASLVFAVTALVGVIVAYVKRGEAAGSWQASHFEWQIRTFWFSLLFFAIGVLTWIFLIGWLVMLAGGIWLIYRIVKGWLRLSQLRAIENPTAFL